jgi:hypothetical protein
MKLKHNFLIMAILAFVVTTSFAGQISGLRQYEPVVITGGYLSTFYDVPIEQLYLYAFDEGSNSWSMVPFQIDERTFGPVPETNRKRWYYFIPDEWAVIDSISISSHDELLSDHDELVFLIQDMGQQAPGYVWIDNEEARGNERLEIIVTDPLNPENKSYAYLFQSSTIADIPPTPYGMFFSVEQEKVSTANYEIGLSTTTGLIKDIAILQPYGNGVDIFDTQKIRFNGILDFGEIGFFLGKNGSPSANERDNLHLYPGAKVTINPVVRIVREAKQSLKFAIFVIDQAAFFVTTKFYPYSGTLEGGASLDPASLKEVLGGEDDILIELDLLRQSFDYNENATGMKFFNQYNSGIVIDGAQDGVDKTVDVPISEWGMVSGDQGSVFTNVNFEDPSWKKIELYFYDSSQGGQGDSTTVIDGDTGDLMSYGDYGILFKSMPSGQDTVNLELGFTAYFLEKNKTLGDAQELANITQNPAGIKTAHIGFPTGVNEHNLSIPGDMELYQNYPNPFNNSTIFSFVVPQKDRVVLQIVDINGRIVNTLINNSPPSGPHSIQWDGMDSQNNPLPSGVYFYTIKYQHKKQIKKFSLIR